MTPAALAAPGLWAGLLVALAATPLLAALARRAGWLDAGDGGRKRQARPVPPVGGLAVLLGLAAATLAVELGGGHWDPLVAAWIHPAAGAAALLLAFTAGTLDDLSRGGLGAGRKLALQGLAGLPVAASVLLAALEARPDEPALALAASAGILAGAVVAQNAFNLFDHADGAATTLGIVALGAAAPVLAAPLLGFLPWNLDARRRRGEQGGRGAPARAPTAYLGDAGSHLLGMLVLLVPAAWPVLALPVLDAARVAGGRLARGARPWEGDCTHLGHRLLARGLAPAAGAGAVAALAVPSAILGAPGVAATAALYAIALRWTRGAARAAARA